MRTHSGLTAERYPVAGWHRLLKAFQYIPGLIIDRILNEKTGRRSAKMDTRHMR